MLIIVPTPVMLTLIIVELESVSLSRGVPVAVRWLVGRYLDSVPRESLEATLEPIQREAPKALAMCSRSRAACPSSPHEST